ncbi:hypothetical protein P7L54_18475 [Acinetobacter bereziniae]|uniref:Uncharacterized protein n=1 Tax=Acinetobacter bereziniae LMG 1003 = CIP 70.12 TaxID=981324 RepID=N9E397_ACIBZ|nr:hypothetical protein [Acinetobacter bereziniae]ENV89404.1 hypothetical protein F938_04330 [Acinetobacter bereziniae LMG 1003 = CIP 70.12]MBJ9906910.1 hypothetical protein [Acinetobacter bereziniae]MBJ9928412.1 hypothetical protein [Acinetobacter bereziniae]MCU4434644.1 hypothetical protein [Acinetobacter bereziniae]MCU4539470.1 hypothetical protein [Acinetobacter bereziniae]
MDFKVVPDLHLPEVPGFKLPNMPELPSGKSVIRFVTDKIMTNTTAKSKVILREDQSKKYRTLTVGEIAMCKKIFKDSIDYNKVKIINKAFLPKQQVPMTPRGHAHYPDGLVGSDIYQDDFSEPKFKDNPIRANGSDLRIRAKLTFIHEMTHVWQYQKGMNILGKGLILQSLEWTLPDSIYDPYNYELAIDTDFKKLNPEQQASIVSDYFGLIEGYKDINLSSAWIKHRDNNLQYIKQVMQPIINDPVGYKLVSNITIIPAVSFIFLIY